jgi:aldose 1-epimerase
MPGGSGRPVVSGENLLAEFAPEIGGRLTRLVYRGEDIIVPLLDDDFDPLFWPKAGGYPLIPYHNRIEAARLAFAGQQIVLEPHPGALPHTLHGPAQRREWRVCSRSENALEMVLDYVPDADWPWAFRASQRFEIGAERLLIELALANTGNGPMPAGLGWHPYFAGGEVGHDAGFWWPHDEDLLPTGEWVVRII